MDAQAVKDLAYKPRLSISGELVIQSTKMKMLKYLLERLIRLFYPTTMDIYFTKTRNNRHQIVYITECIIDGVVVFSDE